MNTYYPTAQVTFSNAVRMLAMHMRGELLQPGDPAYDQAREVWNAAADCLPALIARCTCTDDVVLAIKFAHTHALPIAVRSGGHGMANYGTVKGELLIDLGLMNQISIDPATRVARIEPGLTWAEVAQEAQKYGLALTSGDTGSVGVGGLTLGGGIGWMARKHGLTIDNLRAVDIVTADGHLLHASPTEHAELFWGLRGGGGNFGIATSFEFQLHQAGMVVGGAVIYDGKDVAPILRSYAEYAAAAPDELTTIAMTMSAPPVPFIPAAMHGMSIVMIAACYAGDLEEGEHVLAPLRRIATPIVDLFAPMPYPAMFELTKNASMRGMQQATRSMFLDTLDEAVLAAMANLDVCSASAHRIVQLRILGGAMSRVAPDATAFAHRNKAAMLSFFASWSDSAATDSTRGWIHRCWDATQHAAAGVYSNFLEDEGNSRVKEAYPPATYARLRALKDRYDPENIFQLNQNIRPTAWDTQQKEATLAASATLFGV